MFRFMQTGNLGRFSWPTLIDELVLKLGMLTLLQLVIDIFWQYLLPLFSVDYNQEVFRWNVRRSGAFGQVKAV